MPNELTPTIDEWQRDQIERLGNDPVNTGRMALIVRRFVEETEASRPADLTPSLLAGWLARLERAPATARNYAVALRSWGRYLAIAGVVATSPFESVRVPKVTNATAGADPITDEQAEALVANARAECAAERWQVRSNAPARLVAYCLMLDAGLRIGEVRAQVWRDIDLEARTLTVSADKSKRRDRMPLTVRLVEVLTMLRELQGDAARPEARVVPIGPNAKKMRDDLDRVGAQGQAGRFHRLRKHAITSRAKPGVSMYALAQWARHRDPKTTARYVRASVEELRGLSENGAPAPAKSRGKFDAAALIADLTKRIAAMRA